MTATETQRTDVAIVGGGLAGLAAAAGLAERGVAVSLFESRPRLGGRASSFVDRETGDVIDNCQHVSMGCCTNFDHFCRTVGIEDRLATQPELYFIGRDNVVNRFAAGRLPAPLHLGGAFQSLSYLTRNELKQIRRGLRALCRESATAGCSFAEWLERQNQSPAVVEKFWHVVLVSALSETPDRIDLGYARKVFVDGFLANREGWKVRIPTVPLDELYGRRMTEWFTRHNTPIHLKNGVESIEITDGRAAGVRLRDGRGIKAAHVILAVPFGVLDALLPSEFRSNEYFAATSGLESAPISSVHLWFDRPITDLPHAVLIDRLSQWMFNRTRLQPSSESRREGGGYYYQVVISASRELSGRAREEVIAEVVAEMAEIWPQAGEATLLHSRLVTEHKAVFSPLPGVDDHRPSQQTPIPNLQIAGDWTATGWPATMESAVRSGCLAAENVLRHLGREERLLQPDLPTAFLSKWLLGL